MTKQPTMPEERLGPDRMSALRAAMNKPGGEMEQAAVTSSIDELLEQTETIVDAIQSQNWKMGGCLSVDRPEAIAVVQQLVRTAYSAGKSDGTREHGEMLLRTFDEAMTKAVAKNT